MTTYDGTSITYNGLGNPDKWVVEKPNGGGRGVVNLAYDYEGRVTSMTVPGQGSPYQTNTYNGLGTRVKVVDNGYGSGTRKYVRGGAGVTDPVLRMTTGAESSPTWTNYTPGVSERTSGTSKFMHAGIKNTDAQSASDQSISATREYDAFGNVTSSTGTHTGRFGYGGPYGYQEDEGGLKQLGHRLYDPVAGRFVTKDPIKDGRNWYGYCNNNPLKTADSDGLKPKHGTARVINRTKNPITVMFDEIGPDGKRHVYTLTLQPGEQTTSDIDPDYVWDPVRKQWGKIYGAPEWSGICYEYEITVDENGQLVINGNGITDAAAIAATAAGKKLKKPGWVAWTPSPPLGGTPVKYPGKGTEPAGSGGLRNPTVSSGYMPSSGLPRP